MAVSDLTNTKWVFNNSLTISSEQNYYVNITSNSKNYDLLALRTAPISMLFANVGVGSEAVYQNGSWASDAYKTITITGGTDATNASLISWLEANATQVVPTGKTQIGTRTITKKMFGTREITKEVVNGVVVYEKQAPSGFNVTIDNSVYSFYHVTHSGVAYYSLDDGATWVDIGEIAQDTVQLTGVTQIKFKVHWEGTKIGRAESTQLGMYLDSQPDDVDISQNYTLTQNITDVRVWFFED